METKRLLWHSRPCRRQLRDARGDDGRGEEVRDGTEAKWGGFSWRGKEAGMCDSYVQRDGEERRDG